MILIFLHSLTYLYFEVRKERKRNLYKLKINPYYKTSLLPQQDFAFLLQQGSSVPTIRLIIITITIKQPLMIALLLNIAFLSFFSDVIFKKKYFFHYYFHYFQSFINHFQ